MATKLYQKETDTYYISSESVSVFPCAYRGYVVEDSAGVKQVKQIDVKSRLTLEETLTELSKTSSTRDYIESYSYATSNKTATFKVIARIDGFRIALSIELDSDQNETIIEAIKKNFALKLTTCDAPLSTAAEETVVTKRIKSYESDTAKASSESVQANDYLDCEFSADAGTCYFTGLKITTAANLRNGTSNSEHTLVVVKDGKEYSPSEKRIEAENVAAVNDAYAIADTVVNGDGKFSLRQLTTNENQEFDAGNTADHRGSIALGLGNKTDKEYQVLLGTYTDTSRGADFAIGDGDEESRSNIVEVGPYSYENSATGRSREKIESLYLHNDGVLSIDHNAALRIMALNQSKPSAFDVYSEDVYQTIDETDYYGVKTLYSNSIKNAMNGLSVEPNIVEDYLGIAPKLTLSNTIANEKGETTKYEHCLHLPQILEKDDSQTLSTHLYSDNTNEGEAVLTQQGGNTPSWCATSSSATATSAYLKTTSYGSLQNLKLSDNSSATKSTSQLTILSTKTISNSTSASANGGGAFIITDALANSGEAKSCIAMGSGRIKVSDGILAPAISSDDASGSTSYTKAALKFYKGTELESAIWADDAGAVYIGKNTPFVFAPSADDTGTWNTLYTTADGSSIGNKDHKFSTGYFSCVTIVNAAQPASSTGAGTLQITGGIKQSGIYANYFSGALTVNSTITASNTITGLSFLAKSDRRLKHDIEDYHCEKSILDLPVKKFRFNSDDSEHIGCLAQDLQKICPELVKENDDGYLSIAEDKIVYLLLDEVKKLKAEVDELRSK